MYQSSLFPLRTAVGRAIPIGKKSSVKFLSQSTESGNLNVVYDWDVKPSIGDTVTDSRYAEFLPQFNVGGTTFLPGSGMDALPLPPAPLPIAEDDDVISFFAMAKNEAAGDVSRRLNARFLIGLPEQFLVGGICFGGFPYLPYSSYEMGNFGVNSSNFGLPREVRVVCSGATTADERETSSVFEFLDAEASATKQDIISHSGFHFLAIDPTLTQYLTLQFSDYPRILREVGVSPLGFNRAESRYGFIIPYIYIYEYQETTRYRPQVSAGLLGVKRVVQGRPTGPFTLNDLTSEELANSGASGLNNDYRNIVETSGDGLYYDFTAASIFGQQRRYVERTKEVDVDLKECFISTPVLPSGKIVIYIQQAEDYDRCIAGLKMLMPFVPKVGLSDASMQAVLEAVYALFGNLDPNDEIPPREELEVLVRAFLRIPEDIDFCEKVRIRVFEIDPPEGVSPASIPPDDKYSNLLAEVEIDEVREIALAFFIDGIKFTRPSNCKYFAIELTNYDDVAGQFVVKALRVVQSAHVSIHPRPAKTQQVRTLNFRIIGPNLAEDYALLGDEGFNFSIERFVAGERKSVLFRANSLLDLLHTSAAKIFSNVRRRAVEFEMVDNFRELKQQAEEYRIKKFDGDDFTGVNFENRETDNDNTSWRSMESGRDISWDLEKGEPDFDEFESYSGTEIRSRNQQISSLFDPTFADVNALRQRVQQLLNTMPGTGVQNPLIGLTAASDTLFRDGGQIWRPFQKFSFPNPLPTLPGYQTLNIPPFYLVVMDTLNTLLSLLSLDLSGEDLDPTNIMSILDIQSVAFDNLLASLAMANGISLGVNNGIGVGAGPLAEAALTSAGIPISPSVSGGASLSVNTNVTTALRTSTNGAVGTIAQTGQELKYSLSRAKQTGYDNNIIHSEANEGEQKRIVTRRELIGRDRERIQGAEVMWQGELVDIITGAIPLSFTLPATASKMHFRTADDSLRVRFGSGVGKSVNVDFWFDITEEVVGDDY